MAVTSTMLCEYAPLNFQTGADKSMMYTLNIQNLICIIIHLNVTCTINQNGAMISDFLPAIIIFGNL